jgi:hypothetical protein
MEVSLIKKFALLTCLLLTACGGPSAPEGPIIPATMIPLASATLEGPTPTETPTPSFEPAVYVDEFGRFEISYPMGWVLNDGESGTRGSYIQLMSWQPEAGFSGEIPEGESLLQIAVYLWDPQHDLDARLAMRRTAFEASGNVILEENEVTLLSGQPAVRMIVQDTAGKPSVFLFAVLGDDYVELSGTGDIELLDQIIGTFKVTM